MLSLTTLWVLVASVLVFLMHLGFSCLEAGLTRSKNTVNILFKNFGVLSLGLIIYAFIGMQIMYPDAGLYSALSSFFDSISQNNIDVHLDARGYPILAFFILQAMFAANSATIISGAVAERMKVSVFLCVTVVHLAFIYPVTGFWIWGNGFLSQLPVPFYDFSGATQVHSVGGWTALVAVLYLGPRIGKYSKGKINHIKPHNFSLASIGVFLLWFGWFGFNGGAVLASEYDVLSLVFVNTAFAGAAGTLSAMFISWVIYKRPDLANTLNGALAGLVSITGAVNYITPLSALIIAGIAGCLVVVAAKLFDTYYIDDPVGALSVHLVCGIWGTISVGMFSSFRSIDQIISQSIGVLSIGAYTIFISVIFLFILNKMIGLRISDIQEIEGLDKTAHKDMSYIYHHNPVDISIQKTEKKDMVQHLHDYLGQYLTALTLEAKVLESQLQPANAESKKTISRIQFTAKQATTVLRDFLHDLRIHSYQKVGLIPAIKKLVNQRNQLGIVRVSLHLDHIIDDLPEQVTDTIFQCVQEGLNNILKHAKASHASIAIQTDPVNINIRILDNGIGVVSPLPFSVGLSGIEDSVVKLNGVFSITKGDSSGTLLSVKIPLT